MKSDFGLCLKREALVAERGFGTCAPPQELKWREEMMLTGQQHQASQGWEWSWDPCQLKLYAPQGEWVEKRGLKFPPQRPRTLAEKLVSDSTRPQ